MREKIFYHAMSLLYLIEEFADIDNTRKLKIFLKGKEDD